MNNKKVNITLKKQTPKQKYIITLKKPPSVKPNKARVTA